MNDLRYIFIVGAPRSGTTWLHRMIAEHPNVAAIPQELTLFSGYLSTWFRNYDMEQANIEKGRWVQGMPVVLERVELLDHARSLMDAVYTKVHAINSSANVILDKHPNYANYMELIKEVCPNAKFIHVIRDGRQVALSMMSVNRRVGHSAGDIRQASKDWYKFVTNAQSSGRKLGSDHFEVRYEKLLQNGPEVLTQLYEFCGLVMDRELARATYNKFGSSQGKLSSGDPNTGIATDSWKKRMHLKERFIFDAMAGTLLLKLGYAEPGWWSTGLTDRVRIAIAKPWIKLKRAFSAFFKELKEPVESDLSKGQNG